MRLLLIHTCGAEGSVALADTGLAPPVRASAVLPPRTFSEGLMPAARALLGEAGWLVEDLAAVGVVRGPGSFTGVRTGLSVAKGLCEARGIPLVGVSRLALLARGAGLVHGVLDAGRGEFYHGRYRDGLCEREALVGLDDLMVEIQRGGRLVACEEKVLTALGGTGIVELQEPSAADALVFVVERLKRGADDVLADALYLRRTDAEIFAKTVRDA